MINGKMDTINTDKNSSDFARFVDVTPNASGTVIVNLSRIGVWNYLAGFTITEQGDASGTVAGNNPVSYTHLDVYKRQGYNYLMPGMAIAFMITS